MTTPADEGNEFDAAVEWLVSTGRAASKGAARRRLVQQASDYFAAHAAGVYAAPASGSSETWADRIAGGLAGAGPAGVVLPYGAVLTEAYDAESPYPTLREPWVNPWLDVDVPPRSRWRRLLDWFGL